MEKKDQKSRIMRLLAQIVIIMAGLSVYAAGVALFVLPMDMIAAGTTGLGLVAQHYWGIPLSIFVAGFNILMFVVGLVELGKEFALSTLVATFYYPFALEQATRLVGDMVFTDDPILCAVFSGVMIGFALGIVIRAGASTGGMDIPPLVLQKKLKIPVSLSLYAFDCCVLLLQALFSNVEQVLYGLVLVLLYTLTLNKALMLGTGQMQLKVVSKQYQAISQAIQKQMDRGTTLFHSQGGYDGKEGSTVLTVVDRRELSKLTELVTSIDPNAFMVVSQVNEVRGRGFTLPKRYGKKG